MATAWILYHVATVEQTFNYRRNKKHKVYITVYFIISRDHGIRPTLFLVVGSSALARHRSTDLLMLALLSMEVLHCHRYYCRPAEYLEPKWRRVAPSQHRSLVAAAECRVPPLVLAPPAARHCWYYYSRSHQYQSQHRPLGLR
jgi:hypothetical protein